MAGLRGAHDRVWQFVYWITGDKHWELLKASIESVLRVEPNARIHLYTDHAPPIGIHAQHVSIMPDLADYPPMLSNLVAQTRHMLSAHFSGTTAFIDADILLTEPLLVPGDWDLAVTYRDKVADADGNPGKGVQAAMPYNYGVILARPTVGACEGMLWVRDRVRLLAPLYLEWYGNQIALRELVGPAPAEIPGEVVRHTQYGPLRIKVLHCDTWNYTPQTPDEDIAGRKVLHLKGDKRKPWVEGYLRRLEAGSGPLEAA